MLTGRPYQQLADAWIALKGWQRGVIGTLIVLVTGFLILIIVVMTALVMWFYMKHMTANRLAERIDLPVPTPADVLVRVQGFQAVTMTAARQLSPFASSPRQDHRGNRDLAAGFPLETHSHD